jgi:hypothetical protein
MSWSAKAEPPIGEINANELRFQVHDQLMTPRLLQSSSTSQTSLSLQISTDGSITTIIEIYHVAPERQEHLLNLFQS